MTGQLCPFDLTNRANSVAILTNGSRVLGLGDLGPAAAMPVMEGKAFLFKYLGGVDASPLCVDAADPEALIRTGHLIAPNFGAINLEDIKQPGCIHVLDRLRSELDIPVFHDDQQGTATVILARAAGDYASSASVSETSRSPSLGQGRPALRRPGC